MTYEERERQVCRECRENVKCPYTSCNLEYKCQNLSDTMYGWELGYKDAITKAVEWLDEHLLDYWGQQNSDPNNFLIEFKKAMEQ